MSEPELLRVELGARSYDVVVGEGLLAEAGRWLESVLKQPRAVVVTDRTVAGLYLEALENALRAAGIDQRSIVLEPGEGVKSFAGLEALTGRLLDARVERQDTVLALGGGVVGDLAGFAASILRRGVDHVQLPTTLLAQVDSSIGGKTAINTAHGKNLIGAFHQPRLVLADVTTLQSLPEREFLAGYAEVVKYGLLGDKRFFAWLDDNAAAVAARDPAALRFVVLESCRAKARIVAEDERETGRRALLNLGHTFGHALEAEAGFGEALLHGEAVAMGIRLAFVLSAELGLCPAADLARVRDHFARMGLAAMPAKGNPRPDPDALLGHMFQDKKVSDGRLTLVLVRGIGEAILTRDVAPAQVRALLQRELAA